MVGIRSHSLRHLGAREMWPGLESGLAREGNRKFRLGFRGRRRSALGERQDKELDLSFVA